MWQFHDYGHRKREALFDGGGGYGAALTRTRYASLLCGPWTPASLKPTRYLPSIRASILCIDNCMAVNFKTVNLWWGNLLIDNCNFFFVNFKTANCASVATEHCDGKKSSLISCTYGRVEAHPPGVLIALKLSFKQHIAAIFELLRIWWEIRVSDSLWWNRSLNADDNTGQPTVVDAALAELLKDGCAWHFLMWPSDDGFVSFYVLFSSPSLWGHLSPMMME